MQNAECRMHNVLHAKRKRGYAPRTAFGEDLSIIIPNARYSARKGRPHHPHDPRDTSFKRYMAALADAMRQELPDVTDVRAEFTVDDVPYVFTAEEDGSSVFVYAVIGASPTSVRMPKTTMHPQAGKTMRWTPATPSCRCNPRPWCSLGVCVIETPIGSNPPLTLRASV